MFISGFGGNFIKNVNEVTTFDFQSNVWQSFQPLDNEDFEFFTEQEVFNKCSATTLFGKDGAQKVWTFIKPIGNVRVLSV